MDKINRNNYEAYFLDFVEGNLSEEERMAVLDFIQENPDLKEELEGFELIELPVGEKLSDNWTALKKEKNYSNSQELRDDLFFKALEGELSDKEKADLKELLANEAFGAEFNLWMKLKLRADENISDWSALYELGLDKPIDKNNFEHFLIALAEGMLNSEQEASLRKIVSQIPGGERELKIASKLKLQPQKGIFYPDKRSLYKKENEAGLLIWFARVAAVAALFILGYFIVGQFQKPEDIQVAAKEKVDSTKTKEENSVQKEEHPELKEVQPVQEKPETIQPLIAQEKHILKPGEEHIIDNNRSGLLKAIKKNVRPVEINTLKTSQPELAVVAERQVNRAPVIEAPRPITTSSHEDYKTLPELAEDYMASRFDYNENSNRGFVPTIAQRIAEKAGETFDAEVKTEDNTAGDRSSFTFRMGNFKLTRSNAK